MATTKIWNIRGRLTPVLLYVENPEKTRGVCYSQQDLGTLRDIMDYACDDYKTEQQYYVTGVNCDPDFAREQMMETKQRWHKTDGNLCYHAYQSFAPAEVNAGMAHRIGVELAQKLWGERFEVVVATHLNTRCYHNHFVLNSVSFVDGKKYNDCKASYRLLRETSDALCRQYSLSVIQQPQNGRAMPYAEWRAQQENKPTVRSLIRADIDRALEQSLTLSQLWAALEKAGYALKLQVKYPAVRPPGHTRFFRLHNLGDGYLPQALTERLLAKRTIRPRSRPASIPYRLRGSFRSLRRTKGFRALYIEYLYLLGIRSRNQASARRALFLLREDIARLDRLSQQCKLLCTHRIDTAQQLALYKSSLQDRLDELDLQREALRRQKGGEFKTRIAELTAQMRPLRRDLQLCAEISERAVQMRENLKAAREQEQKRKENQQHEQHRRRGGTGRAADPRGG